MRRKELLAVTQEQNEELQRRLLRFDSELNEAHRCLLEMADAQDARDAEPSEWLDKVTARKVLFHLLSGTSIEGLLTSNLADGPVLQAAILLGGDEPTQMAGEVFIPRANILFAQHGD